VDIPSASSVMLRTASEETVKSLGVDQSTGGDSISKDIVPPAMVGLRVPWDRSRPVHGHGRPRSCAGGIELDIAGRWVLSHWQW
jgi:hypothetical protein